MKLTKEEVRKATKAFLSLDEYVYLYSLYIDEDWGIELTTDSLNKLKTLGFLEKGRGNLTSLGYELFLEESNTNYSEEFEEFWAAYPTNDEWGRFHFTRKIKANRDEAEMEYAKARVTKSKEEILEGLTCYIDFLMRTSTIHNEMKYMKGPTNFLRDKVYLDYKPTTKKSISYGTDLA